MAYEGFLRDSLNSMGLQKRYDDCVRRQKMLEDQIRERDKIIERLRGEIAKGEGEVDVT
jgi:hypothetical protein